MKWRHTIWGVFSPKTKKKTHPLFRCPWIGSLGHWFAGGTMSFHQKRKEAQNLHVLSKDKWSAEKIVKINLRPKALSIPRNPAWILRYRQDKKKQICVFFCVTKICFLKCIIQEDENDIELPTSEQLTFSSVPLNSVAQSCPALCNPMNHSTPGFPVHHQLPEFTQTRVHRVGDAIQPSHPLPSPSHPAPNPSQRSGLF